MSNIENTNPTTPVDYTKNTKSKDYRYIIYTLLTLGLVSALGYIWYSKKNEEEKAKISQQTIVATNAKADDNMAMYQAALVRLDSITGLNTTLNTEINDKDGNVAKLKAEINAILKEGKRDDVTIATLNNKLAALNREIDSYKTKVDDLVAQNKALADENTTVKTERDQVKTELATTNTSLENTKTEKKQLESQVDVGSTLTANNFTIAGINERRNGKEKETSTAKRVDKLRIGFDLDANRITQSGNKKIYVSITSPEGTPITVEALGSGKMVTREEGEKFFTTSLDVDYVQGQKKYINFDWKQNSDFSRGDYKVEVYQNGFKIGEGKVTLKKGGLFG